MNEEKEFDFSYILSTIGRWFILILLFIVIGGASAIFYNYGAPVKYESETTLYVEPSVNSSEVDYQGILTNQRMVKTYAEIIQSRKIVNGVINYLHLNTNYEELIKNITVKSETDTQMITISVKATNKNDAKDIANAFAQIFIKEIASSMGVTNITVIDEAIINEDAVEPRVVLNLAIGIIGGALIGITLSFILESMDNNVKSYKKHKKDYVKPNENQVNIKLLTDPSSVVSESIRMIRTNLNFLDLKLINITSTMPREGKSEFITNLAVSFAMLDKKVLVVDCDLRKPRIHRNFGLQRNFGISDILLSHGMMGYKSVVQTFKNDSVSVDILTAGSLVSNPSEIINSQGFANLLRELREDYDLVLLDCPPISSLTDGVLVSKLADGTVYVIESDRTDYQIISSCVDELQSNKAFILGAVLTKVDVKKKKKVYGYKYDYYYSNYNK